MKEFNLSEKIEESPSSQAMILYLPSVKEFIRIIKQDLFDWVESAEDRNIVDMMINKRAGDKLI